MADPLLQSTAEFKRAFLANEQEERITSGKVASALVCFLMPAGVVLDAFVADPDNRALFLCLRLVCSFFAAILWFVHGTDFGRRHYRPLGLAIAFLPAFFITLMTVLDQSARYPYYAGLNLVLLAVSVVVRWNFRESLLAVAGVLLMYTAACLYYGGSKAEIFNNFYFLVLTGVIVVTGNYFINRLRLREFALQFEVNENRKVLEENNRKLRELDEVKSRFFANISHELRTPLTLLIAPLETLLQRHKLDADTRGLLVTMHSNGMRLLKLINDLLDLVRLESGRMEVKAEPLNAAEFLRGLASAARQVAEDKRLKLETRVDPAIKTLLADRDKLEKVVLNLLFNALKFTPSGGRVELQAALAQDRLVITVSDTGMGIAEQHLPYVFDRFWQADGASNRKYQGVGIGLSLVKEFVEIQGGEVSVQSQQGKGTTFTIRLPYKECTAETDASSNAADSALEPADAEGGSYEIVPEHPPELVEDRTVSSEEWLANLYRRAELFPALTPLQESVKSVENLGTGKLPRVLVADDEPDMLRFLKSQLSRHYQVLEAVDGQQAIEKAAQFLPDLILLDMMMPEKDGLEACAEIRRRTSTQSIPVILLTARADEQTKLQALSTGANDFLAKPFSTTELHVRIKNLIERTDYQRLLYKEKEKLQVTVDQLKETEMHLVQSEKMASLGRLSAGIIHEINNPLNFATTGLFTLRRKEAFLPPEHQEEYREILKDVEDGINRVRNIVSDLRLFTHPEAQSRDNLDVEKLVGAALRFFSQELKGQVEVHQQYAPNQTIWGNHNRLLQVIVNLLQNSLDAFRTKQFDGEGPAIWLEGRVENGHSILLVRDNGSGIEHKHLDKIFDPFYTTKEVGQGMGLGLSICYRIVQDFGGRIAVRTEPGKFTEFRLEFPVRAAAQEPDQGCLVA